MATAGTGAQTCPGLRGRQVLRGMGERVLWDRGPASDGGQGGTGLGDAEVKWCVVTSQTCAREGSLRF